MIDCKCFSERFCKNYFDSKEEVCCIYCYNFKNCVKVYIKRKDNTCRIKRSYSMCTNLKNYLNNNVNILELLTINKDFLNNGNI